MVRPKPREAFRTSSADLGRVKLGSIDDVAGALAAAESEDFK